MRNSFLSFNNNSNQPSILHVIRSSSSSASTFRRRNLKPFNSINSSPIRFFNNQTISVKTTKMGEENLSTLSIGDRLRAIKNLMKDHDLSIYIVPTQDAHGSEYICSADERREFLTGFTGSAGTALVLLDESQSFLFTDGRYFNQASKQLDQDHWRLVKQGVDGQSTWQEVLLNYIKKSSEPGKDSEKHSDGQQKFFGIGFDPTLVNVDEVEDLNKKLEKHSNSRLVSIEKNLVDLVWGKSRPTRTQNRVVRLDLEYTGLSTQGKLKELHQKMISASSSSPNSDPDQVVLGMTLSALDEIAWLFNLRGSDIAFNPVFFSYAWIGIDKEKIQSIILFVEDCQLDGSVKDYLGQQNVEIRPYDQIWNHLDEIRTQSSELQTQQNLSSAPKVLISNKSSYAIETKLGGKSHTIKLSSPIQDLKAIKNPTEIKGFRECHLRDGAALVSYFAWLEHQLLVENKSLNEYEGSIELEKRRKKFSPEKFRGPSFGTISSSGKNAAIIHYSPDHQTSAKIEKDEIYLCDSGGQYLDGTTDVTRTLHFGEPKPEEIRAFTRVLQGHISLDSMVFPEKTTGYLLDSFARQYLWRDGLDYRHGTGHGVGHYLNVHEGPQGVGTRLSYNKVPLKVGMVISNEPGFYKDECFGIRIESMVVVKKASTENRFGDKDYLGFENLTVCPIQTKLIDKGLLSLEEIDWINRYHKLVFEKLSPILNEHNDEIGLNWLKKECKPI